MHGTDSAGNGTNPKSATAIRLNPEGCVPKLCGADVELLNAILGRNPSENSAPAAAETLLRKFRRLHGRTAGPESAEPVTMRSRGVYDVQDRLRTWLPGNGGCAYIDLDHLELCIPEVLSARDALAALHAMFGMAAEAVVAVNEDLPDGQKLVVVVNNSDGQGHSFGGHMNVLMRRDTYECMFDRRPQYMLYLAAFQATSQLLTGAGKVASEVQKGLPYQISQRAEFFEELRGPQTTTRRPLVNTRDEPLCGTGNPGSGSNHPQERLRRLHVIFYDSTLCHVSTFLRFGMMQIVVAMLEAGLVNPRLLLEDPLRAVHTVAADPGLQARIRLADRTFITPVEHQQRFHEEAVRFVQSGQCEGIVPEAAEIVEWWGRILDRLAAQDFQKLTRSLDWVLKLSIVETVRAQHRLDWNAPELKQLDFQYGNLEGGLYWVFEREGAVERLVSASQIERFRHQPPPNTRAWTRAQLLRRSPIDSIDDVDWDRIRFREVTTCGWPRWRNASLANPLGFTRDDTSPILEESGDLAEVIDGLEKLGHLGCHPGHGEDLRPVTPRTAINDAEEPQPVPPATPPDPGSASEKPADTNPPLLKANQNKQRTDP